MTNAEIAEMILLNNGWQEDVLMHSFVHSQKMFQQHISSVINDPKKVIAYWGYQWEAECSKLGIDPLTNSMLVGIGGIRTATTIEEQAFESLIHPVSLSSRGLNGYKDLRYYTTGVFDVEPWTRVIFGNFDYSNGLFLFADNMSNAKCEFDLTHQIMKPIPPALWSYNSQQQKDFIETSESKSDCHHNWKTYSGLMEVFEYCTRCDKKRNER